LVTLSVHHNALPVMVDRTLCTWRFLTVRAKW